MSNWLLSLSGKNSKSITQEHDRAIRAAIKARDLPALESLVGKGKVNMLLLSGQTVFQHMAKQHAIDAAHHEITPEKIREKFTKEDRALFDYAQQPDKGMAFLILSAPSVLDSLSIPKEKRQKNLLDKAFFERVKIITDQMAASQKIIDDNRDFNHLVAGSRSETPVKNQLMDTCLAATKDARIRSLEQRDLLSNGVFKTLDDMKTPPPVHQIGAPGFIDIIRNEKLHEKMPWLKDYDPPLEEFCALFDLPKAPDGFFDETSKKSGSSSKGNANMSAGARFLASLPSAQYMYLAKNKPSDDDSNSGPDMERERDLDRGIDEETRQAINRKKERYKQDEEARKAHQKYLDDMRRAGILAWHHELFTIQQKALQELGKEELNAQLKSMGFNKERNRDRDRGRSRGIDMDMG